MFTLIGLLFMGIDSSLVASSLNTKNMRSSLLNELTKSAPKFMK